MSTARILSQACLLAWASLTVLLFSGVIYGWNSAMLMLEQQGVYCEENCDNTAKAVYSELKFSVVASVAQAAATVTGVLSNFAMDKFGTVAVFFAAGVCMIGGSVVCGYDVDYILGFSLYGIGGITLFNSIVRVSVLFPNRQYIVLTALAVCFDASTAVFPTMQLLVEYAHLKVRHVFLGYGAACGVVMLGTLVLWSSIKATQRHTGGKDGSKLSSNMSVAPSETMSKRPIPLGSLNALQDDEQVFRQPNTVVASTTPAPRPLLKRPVRPTEYISLKPTATQTPLLRGFQHYSDDDSGFTSVFEPQPQQQVVQVHRLPMQQPEVLRSISEALIPHDASLTEEERALLLQEEDASICTGLSDVKLPRRMHALSDGELTVDRVIVPPEMYERVRDRDFHAQLKSPEFLYILFFAVVHIFRFSVYVSTTRGHLSSLSDESHSNLYSKALGAILPLGAPLILMSAPLLSRKGFIFTSHAINAVGFGYGVFQLVPYLWAQMVAAALVTAYRALLFPHVAAFVATVFGARTAPKIAAIIAFTATAAVLAQVPITSLIINQLSDNFLYLRILSLVAVLIAVVVTLWLQGVSHETLTTPPPSTAIIVDTGDSGTVITYESYIPPDAVSLGKLGLAKAEKLPLPEGLRSARKQSHRGDDGKEDGSDDDAFVRAHHDHTIARPQITPKLGPTAPPPVQSNKRDPLSQYVSTQGVTVTNRPVWDEKSLISEFTKGSDLSDGDSNLSGEGPTSPMVQTQRIIARHPPWHEDSIATMVTKGSDLTDTFSQ